MNWQIILFFLAGIGLVAQARVLYVDLPRANYNNPVYYDENGVEQASKDLDMTFSAGEPSEEENIIYPVKKINYVPEKIIYGNNDRGMERPVFYRVSETPSRKIIYRDGPEFSRKFLHFNPKNKGEVVLELRVIANNNNNEV